MISPKSESDVEYLYHSAMNNDTFAVEKALELIDLDDLANEFITEQETSSSDLEYNTLLGKMIHVLNFIENETSIPTTVSDEHYDMLVETYKNNGGQDYIGTNSSFRQDIYGTGYHKYPELRGTLNKVHFIRESDIPENDSRKSLDKFYDKIIAAIMYDKVKETISIDGRTTQTDITFALDFKYDGNSNVFEMKGSKLQRVLTRYKVEENLGKDITHLWRATFDEGIPFDIPKCLLDSDIEYGVKTEVYMTEEQFQRFQNDFADVGANRRSAVASLLNRKDLGSMRIMDYLSIAVFQISASEFPKEITDNNDWEFTPDLNGRQQIIRVNRDYIHTIPFDKKDEFLDYTNEKIPEIRQRAQDLGIPIDGVVITLLNTLIQESFGRKHDVNQFQIAYKFPSGVAKTILKKVTFPIGPVAGTMVPVAVVEPVKIDGKVITNVSLSNLEKLERMGLCLGDEVIIKYDIIPKLYQDKTCKKGKVLVAIPTSCPECGGELDENHRCINENCPAKIPGQIYNYVTKLQIPCIGKQTVLKLCEANILHGIEDLYRLNTKRKEIVALPGFGETSYANMLQGIYSRIQLYPHEILGAIGIPDIGPKTMKLIFSNVDFIELTSPSKSDDERIEMLVKIKGIGEKKATKLVNGLRDKADLITFLESKIDIKEYEKEDLPPQTDSNVVFTQVRDKPFEAFLAEHGIGTSNSVSSKTKAVIIPSNRLYRKLFDKMLTDDGRLALERSGVKKTVKMQAAENKGVPIISIDEYKKMMGYTTDAKGDDA